MKKILLTIIFGFISWPACGEIWLQSLYYGDQQQTVGDMQGYSSDAGAILLGGHKKIANNATLGIGASYFNVVQRYCNYPNPHIVVQNYLGFLYGAINFPQQFQLDWLASGGINNYKDHYTLTNTTTASASHMGQQYAARIVASKCYQKKSIQFRPQLNANVLYLRQSSYTESSSGIYHTASNNGVFTLGAGFSMNAAYSKGQIKTLPEVRALVFVDVLASDVNALTAMLIGGPALRTNVIPGRTGGQFGAGLKVMLQKNLICALNYDLLLKHVYFNNVVSLKFSYLM